MLTTEAQRTGRYNFLSLPADNDKRIVSAISGNTHYICAKDGIDMPIILSRWAETQIFAAFRVSVVGQRELRCVKLSMRPCMNCADV